jgi:membrane-bound lytic murein transglycosylase A
MPKVKPPVAPRQALVKVDAQELPHFSDDMSYDSLQTAVRQSLEYLTRVPRSTLFRFGPDSFTADHLQKSLKALLALIQQSPTDHQMREVIQRRFSAYRAVGYDGRGTVLFTGYYEPTLQGSLQPSADYPYPIYRRPDDWVSIDLGLFDPEYANKRIVGRHVDHTVLPYFSREEIDARGCLRGKKYELLWVSDQIDLFFLHIQGSGRVLLEDGSVLHVNYDCNNGLAYKSIGRLLLDKGFSEEGMSMERIRHHLLNHPDDMQCLFNHNPRYIFFRFADQGPLGALERPLTPGRSIATDMSLFPRAAPAFIQTKKPLVGNNGEIASWHPFGRFVLNHDAGAEIRGPGRTDLFWGSSPYAQKAAGYMQCEGSLYFLVLTKEARE